jgi:hypothetical protein
MNTNAGSRLGQKEFFQYDPHSGGLRSVFSISENCFNGPQTMALPRFGGQCRHDARVMF